MSGPNDVRDRNRRVDRGGMIWTAVFGCAAIVAVLYFAAKVQTSNLLSPPVSSSINAPIPANKSYEVGVTGRAETK